MYKKGEQVCNEEHTAVGRVLISMAMMPPTQVGPALRIPDGKIVGASLRII